MTISHIPVSVSADLIGGPTLRRFLGNISLYRAYQNQFLAEQGPAVGGVALELGGELHHNHSRFFANTDVFIVSNIGRDAEVLCDARHTPLRDRSVDTVVCVSMLQHVRNSNAVLEEIRRVLRPHGNLIIVVPFLFPVCDVIDYTRWTPEGLKQALPGYSLIRVAHLGGRISAVCQLLQRPVGRNSRRYAITKLVGAALALTLGRFDQIDDSPLGVAVHARREH